MEISSAKPVPPDSKICKLYKQIARCLVFYKFFSSMQGRCIVKFVTASEIWSYQRDNEQLMKKLNEL